MDLDLYLEASQDLPELERIPHHLDAVSATALTRGDRDTSGQLRAVVTALDPLSTSCAGSLQPAIQTAGKPEQRTTPRRSRHEQQPAPHHR